MHQRLGKQVAEAELLCIVQGTMTTQTLTLQCQVLESDCATLEHVPTNNICCHNIVSKPA